MLYWCSLVLSQLVAVSYSIRQPADSYPRLPNAAVDELGSELGENQLEGGLGMSMEEWGKSDDHRLVHVGKDCFALLSVDPQVSSAALDCTQTLADQYIASRKIGEVEIAKAKLRIKLDGAVMKGGLIVGFGYANSTDFVSLALQRPDLLVPELAADTKVLVELYGAKLVAEGIERGQRFPDRATKELEDFFEKAKSDFVALSYSKPDLFGPEIVQCIQHLAGVFGAAKVNQVILEGTKNPEKIDRIFGQVFGWKAKVLSRPKRTWRGFFAQQAINATIFAGVIWYSGAFQSGRL